MSDPRPIGVFACDSFGATSLGIASILGEQGVRMLGTAATVEECLAGAPHDDVAVYIVGLNPGDPPGPTLVEALRAAHAHTAIVAYGAYTNARTISLVYEAGAQAYVVKSSDAEVLVEAARTVAAGRIYWAPGIAEDVATFYTSGAHLLHPKHQLTPGEMKLFILLAQDVELGQAAGVLGIGKRAAGNRAVTIRKKLGIERDEFPQVAREYNLV